LESILSMPPPSLDTTPPTGRVLSQSRTFEVQCKCITSMPISNQSETTFLVVVRAFDYIFNDFCFSSRITRSGSFDLREGPFDAYLQFDSLFSQSRSSQPTGWTAKL
jgi:hypothetical protein